MLIDDGFAQLEVIAAAAVATPPAGTCKLFFNASNANRLSQKDAAGAIIDLAASSAAIALPAPTLTNNTVATTETIVARWPIAQNTFAAGAKPEIDLAGQVSSNAALTFRIRFGPAGTIADALLCQFAVSAAGAANAHHYLVALVSFLTATTATATGRSALAAGEVGNLTAAFTPATVNLTVANFLSITLVQSIAQTYTSRTAKLKT